MITPLIGTPGWPELLIILAVVLILFGGSRLAGLGKSTGRALREFKEETKGMVDKDGKGGRASDPELDATRVDETEAHQTATGEIVEPTPSETPRAGRPAAGDPRREV